MAAHRDQDDALNQPEQPADRDTSGWLLRSIRELVRTWGPAILAVILIRTFIFEPYRIPSGSMVPTLLIGDHVLVSKFSYGVWLPYLRKELIDLGDPERGDIIVFRYPRNPSLTYIKRVVGLPGDRVRVVNNRVFINDEPQDLENVGDYVFIDDACVDHGTTRFVEKLGPVAHSILTDAGGSVLANAAEKRVPEGSVFVMGDNRDHSEDSRAWGFVKYDQIKGKAHFVWLSWNGCAGNFGTLRSERLFKGLYKEP